MAHFTSLDVHHQQTLMSMDNSVLNLIRMLIKTEMYIICQILEDCPKGVGVGWGRGVHQSLLNKILEKAMNKI